MTPELVVEITMQPVRRYGVDAAILFSDIVLPLKAVGVDLDIVAGVGPVVAHPVRTLADVDAIPDLTPDHVGFVSEAVRLLAAELGPVPLIGFAGAPFTVASYLVEGGPSKEHALTKAMMFGAPDVWSALMRKIAGIATAYLHVQVAAGASAIQLFDSWAGALAPEDYRQHVMPHSAAVLAGIGTPRRTPHPLRGRHVQPAATDGRGWCGRCRGRLAYAAQLPPSTSLAIVRCRETWTPPLCLRQPTS